MRNFVSVLFIISLLILSAKNITGGVSEITFENIRPVWYYAMKNMDIAYRAAYWCETRNGSKLETPESIAEGAQGTLQIHKGMVDYINSFLGYRKYTYQDRDCPEKSYQMFMDFQRHENPTGDIDLALHIWNAGQNRVKERWSITTGYRAEAWRYINRVLRY